MAVDLLLHKIEAGVKKVALFRLPANLKTLKAIRCKKKFWCVDLFFFKTRKVLSPNSSKKRSFSREVPHFWEATKWPKMYSNSSSNTWWILIGKILLELRVTQKNFFKILQRGLLKSKYGESVYLGLIEENFSKIWEIWRKLIYRPE